MEREIIIGFDKKHVQFMAAYNIKKYSSNWTMYQYENMVTSFAQIFVTYNECLDSLCRDDLLQIEIPYDIVHIYKANV